MGLYISASGILTAQRRNDITAHNVANMRTTGFRASRANSVETATGGVTLGAATRDPAPGGIELTGRPLDVAAADGFFQVTLPDGRTAFTRDGRFGLNANGEVVTSDGARLDPPIQAPANTTSVTVARDGTVLATVPGQNTPQIIGQIQVAQFPNPQGLESLGGNLFAATAASGAPQPAVRPMPVLPGALEMSNVDLTTQTVNQILDRNMLEANVNAFRAQADLLGELLNLNG